MKKIIYYICAALCLAALSACQKGAFANGDLQEVSFRILSPFAASKAVSDGTKANTLFFQVYKSDGTKADISSTVSSVSFPYNLTLKLAKGNSYKILFFAQSEVGAYSLATSNGNSAKVTVDYSALATNNDKGDAFYAWYDLSVSSAATYSVTLKRAVAQLNVGTNDYAEFNASAAAALGKVAVSLTGLPKTVELLDGSLVASEASAVAFAAASSPVAETGTFLVGETPYTWLSMNYVLAPASASLVETSYVFTDTAGNEVSSLAVSNVPLRQNYHTDIVGQILTGDATFSIVIEPSFAGILAP